MNTLYTDPSPTGLLKDDDKPVRRGSLPFKKRRFSISCSLLSGEVEGLDNLRCESSVLPKNKTGRSDHGGMMQSPLISENNRKLSKNANATRVEGMAALAIVAAAAKPSLAVTKPEATEPSKGEVPLRHCFYSYQCDEMKDQDTTTCLPAAASSSLTNVLAMAAAELEEKEEDASLSDNQATLVNNLAAKTGPSPNGCHGRTSRNNAYCRRHPGYKGSMYCKLHYQHYILAGGCDADAVGKVEVVVDDEGETINYKGRSNVNASDSDAPQTLIHHQDKRYTGCPTDIRCKATTTRGRECAYCAVNGKYCYLHADYDTNPPPRRGGVGPGGAASAKRKDSAGIAVPPQTKEGSPKRKSTSARRVSTTKNLEKHMADAPYPLLSTLATEKWYERKVIVSTGPLANHVGLVEKWGNGWVSVRLPGVGLHNRRSFELYLHPGQGSERGSENPVFEVFDTSKVVKPSIRMTLSHDRDAHQHDGIVHEITPLTSRRVIGVVDSDGKGEGYPSKTSSSIMFPTRFDLKSPSTVPNEQSKTLSSNPEDLNKATGLQRKRLRLSLKNPPRPTGEEVPLAQTLMLAQEGVVSNRKLGLLFGTAALERSRRHTHKPARYEGEGVVTKHTQKRNRKRAISEVAEADERGNSVGLVSSSSDEEPHNMPAPMLSI